MKLPITDQQTPNNSQNTNQRKQEVTLELRKYILLLASLVGTVAYTAARRVQPTRDVWQDMFAVSLVVVIILIMILAYYLNDKQQEANSKVACFLDEKKKHMIALQTLQAAMVLDLLSFMGAYAAGTCRDSAFTTIYSSLLVGFVFAYIVIQMAVASSCFTGSGSASVQERLHDKTLASVPAKDADSGSGGVMTKVDEEERRKVEERFHKILMLLSTFAVMLTYLAWLSTLGGFWDTACAGHRAGHAIPKDRHRVRLAVFFSLNTTASVVSLLIVVVLLGRKLHEKNGYFFIVAALGAYNAGSCRKSDTTVYVFSLIPAVLVYISFLFLVADHIHAKWEAMANLFRNKEKAANKARSLVLLLVTLVVSITYQLGLYPPRGVWQDNSGGRSAVRRKGKRKRR